MKSMRDIMTTNVETCSADDSVHEAAVKMKNLDVGAIPVVDGQKNLMGIVTDRDLVIRGYASKKSDSAKIQEVMSNDMVSVSPDTDIQEASQIMADKQIRRLPVAENGKLVGIVSLGDLSLDQKSDQAAGHALGQISEHQHNELH
ncbi:CBS domain-containing protein [Salinibacillus xinjiangensis]|uniref:CBS domain-containing protein n=1 Tax=Salinibacillus xinjiangensis TaxID=1229268 RepID=A0A6G1X3F1_9BACI|nr:CBS domain-containing protein [Salinibacillus xinjiangensis]MRG85523.1 CBS domain-containing protein [Salinibacillus xinjiangensis]